LSVSVDPRIGSELFGYRVEALLGRGGMGVVYKAYDPRLKRHVALKLIAPELSEDERFRERFLAESELAASLDHPNVVPIYDAFDAGGRLAIAMRYVEGTDLKQLLQTDRVLDPGRAVAICGQVAAALDAAHGRGLVHRDVKPSNVLLDENEHVYLADFGLSRRLADPGGRGEGSLSVGTPAYAAPEQIEGGDADGRADVYSLGCLMYECLTGQPPFERDSELAVLWAHVQEPPPNASEHNDLDLPAEIDRVLAKAMAKTPGDRYSSCGELVEAAREGLGLHRPITIRDRRALILTAVGVAVVAAAVLAGVLVSEGKGGHPRRPSTKPTLAIKADSLQRIDARKNRLAATIKVGPLLSAVAVGEGHVWVTSEDNRTVSRIDPKTDRVSLTSAAGADPTHVAVGEGAVWVSNGNDKTLIRLDPRTLKIVQTYLPGGGRGYCGPVAVGEGAVWVADSLGAAGLTRISPGNDLTARAAGVPPCAGQVAVGGGGVWLVGSPASYVSRDQHDCSCFAIPSKSAERVDPVKLKAVAIPLDFVPADIAADEQGVWVVDRRDDFLWRIDPKTNRVVGRVRVGDSPFAVATDGSSVWTANLDDGTVSRIDPKQGEVVATIKVGPRPTDIAADEDGVWVIVHPS
jgi:YVTN family beta-propeller protein